MGKKKTAQTDRLLAALERGQTITRLNALNELGIFELSSRVIALEEKGHIIDKKRVTIENRFNEKISITQYTYGGQLRWARQQALT